MILKNQVHLRLNLEQQELQTLSFVLGKCACFVILKNTIKENTTLITIQYQNAIDKLKKQCKVKNDIEFEMKVSVSSDDLPEYEGKYHLQCFNTYMRNSKSDQTSTIYQYCFELLIH